MFRLGLFQMGLGIMSLLTLGLLNRVMIDELKIPALIAAGAIAMHQIVAPARLWFGQMSDAKTLWGYHRTGYIWIGGALFTLTAFLAVQVVWRLNTSLDVNSDWTNATYAWSGLLGLVFALYGLALSLSSTPFAALLIDVSDEDECPQLVGIVWSMLMVGIVVGAILGGQILDQPQLCGPAILSYDPSQTGLAAGITTSGGISLMLDLTAAETAGVFIGAWGLAQAIARTLATFSGGAILDIGRSLFPNLVFAYGLVFALQALGMIIAVQLLNRVDVQEFQTNSKQAIAAVLGSDLD